MGVWSNNPCTPPPSKAYRDNYAAVFGKSEDEALYGESMRERDVVADPRGDGEPEGDL